MTTRSKTPLLFIILVVYVLLQFSWWLYLLLNSQAEVYENLMLLDPTISENLQVKLQRKQYMILGEGVVFLILLLLGASYTIKAFRKEVELGNQQRNFLLSITHELKSPLASIKLYLQTLLKHNLDEEKKTQILKNSLIDTERLSSLVDNILIATKIENNSYPLSLEEVELGSFVKSLFDSWPDKKKDRLQFNLVTTKAKIDRLLYASAVMNLVDNALKYSDDSVVITIKNKTLQVADTGIGIAKQNHKKVFDRFYREGNEQTRTAKGTGLGLYLVKQIVELHKGKVNVRNNQPKGSVFSLEV